MPLGVVVNQKQDVSLVGQMSPEAARSYGGPVNPSIEEDVCIICEPGYKGPPGSLAVLGCLCFGCDLSITCSQLWSFLRVAGAYWHQIQI